MKTSFIIISVILCTSLYSCKKSSSPKNNNNPGGGTTATFTAKVNDTAETFNLYGAATLIRSTADNEKRFDMTGISTNSRYRLTLTIGEETAVGNGITTGDHSVVLFSDDDTDTDAFYTFGVTLNNGGGYLTDVFSETGNININTNTPGTSTGSISGTFTGTLTSLGGGTNYTITQGSFSNITYSVLN
jgi:hypothetical protein